jgi:hypothetical protein
MAASVSVDAHAGIGNLAFSASATVKIASSYLSSSSAYGSFTTSSKLVTLYDVVLPPSDALVSTDIFKAAWNKLPNQYVDPGTPWL